MTDTTAPHAPFDQAIDWALRLPSAGAEEWRAFTTWLEQSPANARAYGEVAEAEQDYDAAAEWDEQADLVPARADRRRFGAWLGGSAIAAAAIAALAIPALRAPSPEFYAVETVAGVRQSVSLQDGSEIAINGDSRLTLDRHNPRFARLDSGEALFTIADRPDSPFRVEARGTEIRNIGTVFGVRSEPGEVAVEVAEGAVRFEAGRQSTRLSAGERATFANGLMVRGTRDVAAIGGWRDGQLSFASAPLADVARDIERASGIAISADPALAGRRFSGNILIDDDRALFRRRLAALLGVEVRLVDGRWVLAPSAG